MVGVVAGMCVYVFHPPVPLYKSFYRANLLGFFFSRGGFVSCQRGRCME